MTAIVLLAMTAYDLTAALNNDRTFLWVSCAARWAAVTFEGAALGATFLGRRFW
jgi:hypothetical protein